MHPLIDRPRSNYFALLCLSSVAAMWLWPAVADAQWGNVKVKFVYAGTPPKPAKLDPNKDTEVCAKHPLVDESLLVDSSGGVANIVLYVRTKEPVKVHPDYAATAADKVVYDNKGCRFQPHILTIRLSQTLELHNSDPIGHNSNLQPLGDTPTNPLLPGGAETTYKFTRAKFIPQPISCNIHPWMKGYILPRENPYAAASAADGTLELKNVPTGEHDFQAWHEVRGYLESPNWPKGKFKHTVKEGDNDLGTIKLDPKLFVPKS